ncbi:hypothetical protein C0J52_17434 [Blattella germanica]|nr:hypothetical protein C0J52_17434 [Blattella germanica]
MYDKTPKKEDIDTGKTQHKHKNIFTSISTGVWYFKKINIQGIEMLLSGGAPICPQRFSGRVIFLSGCEA